MYLEIGPVIKFGVNKIQTYHTYPEVYCLNKVSNKPAKALRKLKETFETKNSPLKEDYDLFLRQNYTEDTVELSLLGHCKIYESDGSVHADTINHQYVYGVAKLPVTSSAKRYVKAIMQLLKDVNGK